MFATIVVAHDGTDSGDAALELAERLRGGARVVVAHVTSPRESAAVLPPDCLVIDHPSVTQALDRLVVAEHADLLVVGPSHRTRFGRALLNTTGQRLLHGAPCAIAVATYGSGEVRRIGVAHDGSVESDLALEAAYALARETGAAVRIYRAAADIDAPRDEELEQLAALGPQGIEVDHRVLRAPAVDVLPAAAAGECDLVVCGSRGHGPLKRVFLGSVSAALAGAGSVPVLVTPRGAAVELEAAS